VRYNHVDTHDSDGDGMRLPSSELPLAFAERAWDGVAKLTKLEKHEELRAYFQEMGK
jgi:hypothetical protein